ncbi:MAG: hypothetical protein ACLP8S_28880, partial [Solirubrobacteraceae bacterium]
AALFDGGSLHARLSVPGVVAGGMLRVPAGWAVGVQPAADPVKCQGSPEFPTCDHGDSPPWGGLVGRIAGRGTGGNLPHSAIALRSTATRTTTMSPRAERAASVKSQAA